MKNISGMYQECIMNVSRKYQEKRGKRISGHTYSLVMASTWSTLFR